MGLFNFKKKGNSNNRAMTSGEIDQYTNKLESLLVKDGPITFFDNLVISAFIYAKIVYNTSFLFANDVSLADVMIFTSFVNAKRYTKQIRYESLVDKYTNLLYSKTCKLFKALYDVSDTYISDLTNDRISFLERVYQNKIGSFGDKLGAVEEEFAYILCQDTVEKRYMPFDEKSALSLVGIQEFAQCIAELNLYLSKFDQLYGKDIDQISKYLLSTQQNWDNYYND